MKKARIVGWNVQPVVMVDDGDDLVSQPVEPMFIPAKQWDEWSAQGWQADVDTLKKQIESEEDPA